MALTGKSVEEIEQLKQEMLRHIPEDGTTIGNKTLRDDRLNWKEDLYLAVRAQLIEQAAITTGRGKGGSVRRIIEQGTAIEVIETGELPNDPYPNEESLYDSLSSVIRDRWVKEGTFDQVLVENTARGGRRRDGIWSRPDITVAAMTTFTYVPGRVFDVVTFEVKHYSGLDVTSVYEALAHRRSATRSIVLAYIPDDQLETMQAAIVPEIEEEAARHGIGLIVASDPENFDTWTVLEEGERAEPDPARLNNFIRNQLAESSRDKIVRWFRV